LGIAAGPENALWFAENVSGLIGKIDVNGAITEYGMPPGGTPQQIVTGPDGNLYFTAPSGNYIGQLVPATGTVTLFAIPTPNGTPTAIMVGADGNIWFAETAWNANVIAAMSTSGNFSVVTPIATPGLVLAMTLGPDRNIWFTQESYIGVVRSGSITRYSTPTFGAAPQGIVAGPDGSLWFTESNGGKIGKITTTGNVTEYATAYPNAQPGGITVGQDGALWFGYSGLSGIGRITTSGEVSEYEISTDFAGAGGIVEGPDHALWFTESGIGKIGRLGNIGFESFEQRPGQLTQLSVGSDGTVWGINSAQQIYAYDISSQAWTPIPGFLSRIAVGSSSAAWGINSSGAIYRWTGSEWVNVPGSLAQIAVGGDGDVWGLNALGQIYHYSPAQNTWVGIKGRLNQISVGSTGAVYGVYGAGYLYWYNPGTGLFQQVTAAAGFLQISAGIDGDMWAVKNNVAYHYNVLRNRMDATTGSISSVMIGSGAAVFGLGSAGKIYQWDPASLTWLQLPGFLSSISVGANGTMCGVNDAASVYCLAGNPKRAQNVLSAFSQTGPNQISVGVDGSVWEIDLSSAVEFFNSGTQAFEPVPEAPQLTQISVGAGADVWGVNCINPMSSSCTIYQYDAASGTWNVIPGELNSIQVAANGSVWGINYAGLIYTYDSSDGTWINLPGQLTQLSVGADGTVWGINGAQQIYAYNSAAHSWTNVPGLLAQISVGNANNVWGVNGYSQVYYFDFAAQTWVNTPGVSLNGVWTTFDGAAWGVLQVPVDLYYTDKGMFQWNAAQGAFKLMGITGDVSYVAAGNSTNVWLAGPGVVGEVYWFF